jgi:hypothetical protein
VFSPARNVLAPAFSRITDTVIPGQGLEPGSPKWASVCSNKFEIPGSMLRIRIAPE